MSARILYIQHAGSLGGSCLSLLYLIQGLDRSRYTPIVATIYDEPSVMNLYRDAGIETIYWPGIGRFDHTTLGWHRLYSPLGVVGLLRQLAQFRPSIAATEALIEQVRPDLVHLNSLVLAASAAGVKRAGLPLVWHVREPVHPGHVGLRKRLLSRTIVRLADEAIFISNYDRQQLTGGRIGTVVYNFVDLDRFNRTLDGSHLRSELGVPLEAKVILFLGGRNVVKGVFPLLKAMSLVKQQVPTVHLLIANGAYRFSGRAVSAVARTVLPLVGYGTVTQRVDKLLERYTLYDCVHMLEWRTDVPQLLAASDLLVFPSIAPHFARPVIEAGAMAKPVVASRIGGVEELVVGGETGLLVPPGDAAALAQALVNELRDADLARRLGKAGHRQARQRFDAGRNIEQVIQVYERALSSGSDDARTSAP